MMRSQLNSNLNNFIDDNFMIFASINRHSVKSTRDGY